MRYIKLLYRLLIFKMNLKLMYRFDFWAAFFADGMLFVVQILMFGTIFTSVDQINGWEFYQIVVFVGTFTIVDGLAMGTYFFGVISLPEKIRSGELDVYIVKPVDTLFLVSFNQIDPGSLLVSVLGMLMVGYGMSMEGATPNVAQIGIYILAVVSMYILMYSLMVLLRTISFWFVKVKSLMDIENSVIEMAFMVPGSAFKGVVKILFMIVIPYGLLASGPTYVLTEWMSLPFYGLVFGISIVFYSMARLFFKKGMSIYSSASS